MGWMEHMVAHETGGLDASKLHLIACMRLTNIFVRDSLIIN